MIQIGSSRKVESAAWKQTDTAAWSKIERPLPDDEKPIAGILG